MRKHWKSVQVRVSLLIFVASLLLGCTGPRTRDIYLPVVSYTKCLPGEAGTLETLLTTDVRQQRPAMRCSPALSRAAYQRALNLSKTGLLSHCDETGKCANTYAREAGCRLPDSYDPNGTNVESFILGPNNTTVAYTLLALSPSHAAHLFGQNDFFRAQDDYGMAVLRAPGTYYEYYYVFYIGDCQ